MHLARCRRHFGNRRVNSLDELVECAADFAELVFAGHVETSGQITFALGNVLHGHAHGGQRAQQYLNQQAQEHRNSHNGNQHRNQGRSTEFAQRGIGFFFVDRKADVPVSARQAADRREGKDAILTVEDNVLIELLNAHVGAGIDVLEILHHLVLVRTDDDLAITADQERMADTTEVYRVDDLHQCLQAQVTTDNTQQLAILFHRHGNCHDLTAHSRHIRRSKHGFVRHYCLLVPRALTGVVVVRHLRVRALCEYPIGLTYIGELEIGGECWLIDQTWEVGGAALVGNVLRQVLEDQDATTEPVLHTAGGELAGLLDGRRKVLPDGAALQVVVVEGK